MPLLLYPEKNSDDDTAKEDTNKGTLTIDATCSPANICYS